MGVSKNGKGRTALHRGLGKLLSSKILDDEPKKVSNEEETTELIPKAEILSATSESSLDQVEIDIEKIDLNPDQPRTYFNEEELQDLARTIKEIGVISPLTVTKTSEGYQLIAGERRLKASKLAGLKKVPVFVMNRVSKKQRVVIGLVENLQRSDLNDIEIAESFQKLQNEFNLSHEEIADATGKSRSNVSNTLRLLRLPDEIQNALIQKNISSGHARCLVSISDADKQISTMKQVISKNMNVRQLEELVNSFNDKRNSKRSSKKEINPNLNDALFTLSQHLGAKINVVENAKGGGKIVLKYSDTADFNRIYEIITG